ncbi:MAG: branched-chain amino acid transaminase [Cenarchaeum sp. SB0665_bin_23]|nr:branched-chain amino acid transaminase [Cenarchaeum sp. SB0667_bin_13]MXY61770.1 branched-chain amino acid transaminase [Cenarchaeum sp. SB0665_bin_23]MXZ93561.1 branched-chain amino acid transaminase [Cenarchaeum sp. SB0666_bin_15]MYB47211.1 branched-chain amino acid transaminase [Cenarchaeum sp. SB0662_bin_33]MYC80255.1 branched-chain amino acid transaminase [Cenarchaeum sp. SB0661_bin_35]MYD58652.1 branched-chain amino acid transaminase [Cenarchaeum sp. SB0678_bin_8]MYG32552.1 branched-
MGIQPCDIVWLDGEFVGRRDAQVPVTTHALHYGTSAFEGIRAYWTGDNLYIFRLYDHIRRLRRSGAFYQMTLHYTDEEMADAIIGTCSKNNLKTNTYIRPLYFVGDWGIHLEIDAGAPTISAVIVFPLEKLFDQDGLNVGISSYRRLNDQCMPIQAKVGGNYLNSITATMEAKTAGYDEAIMLDLHGNVSETPGANIFLVQNGELITPDKASSALDGITRDTIDFLASQEGIRTVYRRVAPSELYLSDEVFIVGTAAEVTPVKSVRGRDISCGQITDRIKKIYTEAVTGRRPVPDGWLTPVY